MKSDDVPASHRFTIPTALCGASAAASLLGLFSLATLASAPAWHSLPWYAVVAFGLSAPLGFAGLVLALVIRQHQDRGVEDDLPGYLSPTLELLAATALAGAFAGAACLTTFMLFAGNARANTWPLYAYGIVFGALAFVLLHSRLSPLAEHEAADEEERTGYASTVQLVTDNTVKSRARAKAVAHSRIRIHSDELEMRDWSRRYACTPDQLRAAIAAVGTVAADVEAYLGKSR